VIPLSARANAHCLLATLSPGARILILRLRSIGDIILLTPALRLLKEWRADLNVTVLIEDRFRGLLENNPYVDAILEVSKASGLALLGDRLQAIRRIRRGDFQLCVNLHGGPTSATITSWSGARCKAAFEHFRGIFPFRAAPHRNSRRRNQSDCRRTRLVGAKA
jgi:ADP-heptose:LPS heptosyltransferase